MLEEGKYSVVMIEKKTGIICNHDDGEYRLDHHPPAEKVFDSYSDAILYIKLKLETAQAYSFVVADDKDKYVAEWF